MKISSTTLSSNPILIDLMKGFIPGQSEADLESIIASSVLALNFLAMFVPANIVAKKCPCNGTDTCGCGPSCNCGAPKVTKSSACVNKFCTCGAACGCGSDCTCGVPKDNNDKCINKFCTCPEGKCNCGLSCRCGCPANSSGACTNANCTCPAGECKCGADCGCK